MDVRGDSMRKKEAVSSKDKVRDLEDGGVKKSDPGHYPCYISSGLADRRFSVHYTS